MLESAVALAHHTTLGVGGPAREFAVVEGDADLVDAVSKADADATPVLILGGGSNLVVADEGFDGLVVQVATRGVAFDAVGEHVVMKAAAGENWDDLVAAALTEGVAGLECLSGIPGLAGATPIQNVGAYGAEIGELVAGVRAFDRVERAEVTLSATACGFGYRTSALKGGNRYVVLGIEISLTRSANSAPVRYAELAGVLDVELGGTAATRDVRAAVLALRAKKGMLVDPADPDSRSAGSFFTNPVLAAELVPGGAPRWPMPDGRVKTSAAWLIEHAGFGRGYGTGPAGLSTKHTLALVNRGGATASDIVSLAREIRDGVEEKFGVRLEAEPMLVGVSL